MSSIDAKRTTFDSGVMANFEQESRARASDLNLQFCQLDYCGILKEILEVSFRAFTIYIFDVKWFRVICNGSNATVRRDNSGFYAIDSTKFWTNESDTYVLPGHCEQVSSCMK